MTNLGPPSPDPAAALRSGLMLRAAQWADAASIAALTLIVCTADGDPTVALTEEDLITYWKDDRFVLETDAWVVTTQTGKIVGYQEFFNRYAHTEFEGESYSHPDYVSQGIGEAMLAALENRAYEDMQLAEPHQRAQLRSGMSVGDTTSRGMHEEAGYAPVRYVWRMEVTLEKQLAIVQFPQHIILQAFEQNKHARLVYEAAEEAFSEHWGHTPESFENWRTLHIASESFDPSLWFIAWDGDKIVGTALCRYRAEIGYVGMLGVLKSYRGKGLGLALLQHSFHEFLKRGTSTIGLGVDASNPTGATRLYKRAGMEVASEYVVYEKVLREGNRL